MQDVEPRLREVLASAVAQGSVEGPGEAAGQGDQPLAVARGAGAATRGSSPSGTPK